MTKFVLDDDNLWSDNALTDRQTDRPQTLSEKIEESKRALRLGADMSMEYYGKPLIVTYSGGKDSDVMLHLAETTLKPTEFEVLNNHTTVDAPETVYHIKDTFKRLNRYGIKTRINYHIGKDGKPMTMWKLIQKKLIPPTRLQRYCCQILKETGTPERICAVGVREDESIKRQGRDIIALRGKTYKDARFYSLTHADEVYREAKEINDPAWDCKLISVMKQNEEVIINPIYHFSESDIWNYIQKCNIKTNPMYECGYRRVGCIGCPMATYKQKMKEFSDYPKYKQLYIRAFDRMLEERKKNSRIDFDPERNWKWKDGESVFNWWIEEYKYNIEGQMTIDEWLKGES